MNMNFKVQTGRPVGTKIARKAIREQEFQELLLALEIDNSLQPHMLLRHRRAFTILYYLGMRVGELLILRVGDLRKAIKDGEVQLEGSKTKTKRSRLLQLSSNAQEAIYNTFERLIEDKNMSENYYIFSSNNPFRALNKANFTLHLNSFIHDTIGELYSTHSFRQGLITDMIVVHNMPLVVAQTFIGHSSMMTTARYAKATEQDTRKAIDQVR